MKSIAFILLLFPICIFAQNDTLNWAPVYRTPALWHGAVQMINQKGDSCSILIGEKLLDKKVLVIDSENAVVSEAPLDLQFADSKTSLIEVIETRKRKFILSEDYIKKKHQYKIFASEFKRGIASDPKLIFVHNFYRRPKPIYTTINRKLDVKTKFQLSVDSNYVAFANQRYQYTNRAKDQIIFAVFDSELKLQWEKIQEFPYPDGKLFVEDIIVGNQGKNIFAICAFAAKTNQSHYQYKIFHITKNNCKEYEIDLENKLFPTTLIPFYQEEENHLLISGLCKKKRSRSVNAVFNAKIDLGKAEVSILNYHFFSEKNKSKLGIHTYNIVDYIKFDNGNIQVFADSRISQEYDEGDRRYDFKYRLLSRGDAHHFDDLLLWTIDENGKVINDNVLSRRLSVLYPKTGVSYFKYKDHAFVIYDSKTTNFDRKKYGVDGMNAHRIYKIAKDKSIGERVSVNMLFHTSQTKFELDDITSIVKKNKLIIGGNIYKLAYGPKGIYGEKKFKFASISLDDF